MNSHGTISTADTADAADTAENEVYVSTLIQPSKKKQKPGELEQDQLKEEQEDLEQKLEEEQASLEQHVMEMLGEEQQLIEMLGEEQQNSDDQLGEENQTFLEEIQLIPEDSWGEEQLTSEMQPTTEEYPTPPKIETEPEPMRSKMPRFDPLASLIDWRIISKKNGGNRPKTIFQNPPRYS